MTRRTRRPLHLLALALVALLTLLAAGCGGDGGDDGDAQDTTDAGEPVAAPTEPVTITFASWVGNEPNIKKLAKKFQQEYPTITVKFQNVPFEQIAQKLTTQVAGGNPPDAAYIDAGTTADFASRGALVNLDSYIERSEDVDPDDFVEAFAKSTQYEGSWYGIPFDGETTGLFYRTDLFEQAGIDGPPTTWEEFEEAARELTDEAKKQYGYILFATEAAYYWYPWLWQAGGEVLTEDGEVAFTSDEAREAAEFYVGLREYSPPDYLNSNSYDGRVAFAQGKVAMYMAGSWFAGTLEGEYPKIKGKWATAPLPEGDEGCATTIAGDNLVVFDASANKDAAWLWIEFLSRPENMATWTFDSEGSTLLPPREELLDSPELEQKKPVLAGFAEAMKCGVVSAANPKGPKIEQALNEQLGRAMYGEVSSDEALDNAAEEAEKILAE
ncbi:MAG: sugar ABC transporter substrate-binding protein [Thermoleophilia bacterium]|nr:sugar ABC transporter substrate-binding protein [Thermoleophilia bacterium]